MSTQEKIVSLLQDIKTLLTSQNDNWPPSEPRGILGGDIFTALPYLDGWNYIIQSTSGFKTLMRGNKVQIFPDWVDQEGWVISGNFLFSDPDCHLTGSFDNLSLDITPRQFIYFHDPVIGAQQFKCNIYDAAQQNFGIAFGVNVLAPYNKKSQFVAYLDMNSLNSVAYLKLAQIQRVQITDRKAFFNSLKRFALQQSLGKREVPTR